MLSSDSFFPSASSLVLKCRTPVSTVDNKSFFAGVVFVVSLHLIGCCSGGAVGRIGCCGIGSGVMSTGCCTPGGGCTLICCCFVNVGNFGALGGASYIG
eukprot:4897093-Amphidinium_carterae.1